MLREVPRLGLSTTDQVRACALAGTEPPSNISPVSTAPPGRGVPASIQRRVRRRAAPQPRAQTVIRNTAIGGKCAILASAATVSSPRVSDATRLETVAFPCTHPRPSWTAQPPPHNPAPSLPAQTPREHRSYTPIRHDTPETSGTSRFTQESDTFERAAPPFRNGPSLASGDLPNSVIAGTKLSGRGAHRRPHPLRNLRAGRVLMLIGSRRRHRIARLASPLAGCVFRLRRVPRLRGQKLPVPLGVPSPVGAS
jgi:hypothetical protein